MLNIFRNTSRLLSSNLRPCSIRYTSNLFEPDYLEALKPKTPVHTCVDFQITGYDFPVLESYQRFLFRTAEKLNLDVSECWATPAKDWVVTKLKPKSTTLEGEFHLKVYERNLQVYNLPAHFYPIYLRLAQAGLPEGVKLNVVEHQPEHDEIRYVPDTELKELQDELEDLGGARKMKKKKR